MSTRSESIEAEGEGERREHVGSLERGLRVIEVLASHPQGLTMSAVAARTGLTRAGARRLLLTLVAAGYVYQEERIFRLSPRLITLGRTWLSGASLWSFAEPFMRKVSRELNESCSAAVLSGEDVVYVARVAGARIVGVALHVGTRLPAHCTSMGRVLLSQMSDEALRAFLARATIRANTARTVTDRQALFDAIVRTRADGYALVDEELEIGLRSIAVPLRDRSGAIVAAVNVSTQSARMSVAELRRNVLPILKGAAASIEDFFVVQ